MRFLQFILYFLFLMDLEASELKNINWKLHKEKDNIKVYKPLEYKHASGIVPIRFKAKIGHNISKVLTVMADNTRKKEWVPSVKEIKTLENFGPKHRIVYYRYNAPWPFNDRDFIVRSFGEFDSKEVMVSVELKSVKHTKDPRPRKAVRGIAYDGYSIIRAKGEHETEVEMAFLNDFKGNIPTFVINFVQARWPYSFMKNLRMQLAKQDIVINPEYTSDAVPWKQESASASPSKLRAD